MLKQQVVIWGLILMPLALAFLFYCVSYSFLKQYLDEDAACRHFQPKFWDVFRFGLSHVFSTPWGMVWFASIGFFALYFFTLLTNQPINAILLVIYWIVGAMFFHISGKYLIVALVKQQTILDCVMLQTDNGCLYSLSWRKQPLYAVHIWSDKAHLLLLTKKGRCIVQTKDVTKIEPVKNGATRHKAGTDATTLGKDELHS